MSSSPSEAKPERPTGSHPAVKPPMTARILVVDDERVIREILTDFLEMEGYTVVSSSDGQEALARLQAGEPIDVVTLILKSEEDAHFETVVQQVAFDQARELDEDLSGDISVDALMSSFANGKMMLLHGADTAQAFSRLPGGKTPTAFVSLPLRV